jgi:hypothetical protein
MWSVLAVASLVLIGSQEKDPYTGKESPLKALCALLFLVLLFFVGASYGSLRRLHKVRRVLRSYPWEYRESARKTAKEPAGFTVRLKPGDEDDGWSRGAVARNPLKWNRWTPEMEHGAWFAGDLPMGGVIALPGGDAFMLLSVLYRLSRDQKAALMRDRARMERAKTGGISGNLSGGYR